MIDISSRPLATAIRPLVTKLLRQGSLSAGEVGVLEAAAGRTATLPGNKDIVEEGSSPKESCLLIGGFAARYKQLQSGGRQITALHVPGDFVDLHSFLLQPMDHSIIALSDCKVVYFPHTALHQITEKHPGLTRMLWADTLRDGAIHREWLVAMGRLSAEQHTAHFLCELYLRLGAIGLVQDDSFALPLTQSTMADTMGLSHVHMNRALQALRAKQAVSFERGMVVIKNFEALAKFAEFDPTYLGRCGTTSRGAPRESVAQRSSEHPQLG